MAYNNASGGNATGTAKRKQIDARINAMIAHMHKYMEQFEEGDKDAGKPAKEIAA